MRPAPSGERLGTIISTGLEKPWALAVGPDGDIYVTDLSEPNTLKRFSPDGELKDKLGEPGLFNGAVSLRRLYVPVAVAVSPQRDILLAENLLNRIQALTPDLAPKWALYGGAYFENSSLNSAAPEHVYGLDGYNQGSIWEYNLDLESGGVAAGARGQQTQDGHHP